MARRRGAQLGQWSSRPQAMRVVQPRAEGYAHTRAFDEVAQSLVAALERLGFAADLGPVLRSDARNVVLGSHLLTDAQIGGLPGGTIAYNHEQIDPTSMLAPDRLAAFSAIEVWDYSRRNIEAWRGAGIEARYVPIGWGPELERIRRSAEPDIDVLFYGSLNERRAAALDALEAAGLRVVRSFGDYGEARDALIARARVVLNVQYYEARILEIVRLSYLFANAVPVVSETSPGIEIPEGFEDAAAFAPYGELVGTVRSVLADPGALAAQGRRGQERMRAMPWESVLAPVLGMAPATDGPARSVRSLVEPEGPGARTVEVHCGPLGPSAAATAAVAPETSRALADAVADLVAAAGSSVDTLGPPPLLDGHPEARAHFARRMQDLLATAPEAVSLVAPGIDLIVPEVLDAVRAADIEDLAVVLAVDHPSTAVAGAGSPVEAARAALRWLSGLVFAEALTRDTTRRIDLGAGPAPAASTPAMALAVAAWSTLSSDGVDQAALDAVAGRYLDAMALYLPLLDP